MRAKMEAQEVTHLFTAIAFNTMNTMSLDDMAAPLIADASLATSSEGGMACLALSAQGTLVPVNCTAQLPYICYKEPKAKCGPMTNGYKYEVQTGSCYKFHRQAKVWRWALNTCHTEGGHLAIINSDVEHTVLFNLFLQNPPPTHIGSRDNQYAYVGFLKWTGTDWASIYGDPLGSLGFERWAQHEPNNKDGLEDCGSIYSSNGLLNDMQCWVPSAFICEITP